MNENNIVNPNDATPAIKDIVYSSILSQAVVEKVQWYLMHLWVQAQQGKRA